MDMAWGVPMSAALQEQPLQDLKKKGLAKETGCKYAQLKKKNQKRTYTHKTICTYIILKSKANMYIYITYRHSTCVYVCLGVYIHSVSQSEKK